MKQYTYIDLEDAIYKAWQTCDDLDMFYKHHGDHPVPMSEDEVSNMILGIKQLHNMRMEALMDMMCRVHKLNQYTTCLLYTSPSPRDRQKSRMPSSA